MRRRKAKAFSPYNIIVVDDEQGIVDSLNVVLSKSGYNITCVTDPLEAIECVRNNHYDLMILDFLMQPIHGDKVVEKIREFNRDLYILLLTGHKDMAPPLETIRALAIQGYCEKSDKFDQLLLLVESGIKSIEQMRTIKQFKDGLNEILQAVPKIYQLQPIDKILEDILIEIMPLINSKDAFIIVDNTNLLVPGDHSIFRGIGKYKTEIQNFMELLDPHLMAEIGSARTSNTIKKTDSGVILPLFNELKSTTGVIFVTGDINEEGIKLLSIYSSQASSSLNNAFLHSLVNVQNDQLNRTYEELKQRYMDTIEALRLVVDAKDKYTRGHSDRVSTISVAIGESFSLDKKDIEILRISGLFHDIGKIGTTDDILLKTEKLELDEYELIKKHPNVGADILSAMSMFSEVVPIVRCHHERVDGSGYPEGLMGNEIPFLSRIIAVADGYDAMTSDRHYRSKLCIKQATKQLQEGAGTQFDKVIVEKFIAIKDTLVLV